MLYLIKVECLLFTVNQQEVTSLKKALNPR